MTVFHSMSTVFRFPLTRLLGLPTEAWRGVEIRRRSAENGYVNLPGPLLLSLTKLSETNILAYTATLSMTLGQKNRVFVCRKFFQPSLIFVDKVREPTPKGRPKTLDLLG